MEIKRLDQKFINGAMHKSASRYDVTSWHNFQKGWRAAIRFAKKVEDADEICTNCGKLLDLGNVEYDAEQTPFCEKCYQRIFDN